MRLFTLIALTSLSAQAKPLDLKVQERTLSNGLQVVSVERFAAPTVSVQLWVRTGSRHERPGITGIAHLFEHMMFKGSKNLGPEKHAQEVMKIGGQLNAYTTHDATVYYEDVAAHNYDLKAAQDVGFKTAFVRRPTEHGPNQTIDLEATGDWDVCVESVTDLAAKLSCH